MRRVVSRSNSMRCRFVKSSTHSHGAPASSSTEDLDAELPPASTLQRLELTPREIEVLTLVADGMTNREIASELFISNKTASAHVSHILSKLSAPNRTAAAATARRLGLGRDD